MSYHQRDEIRWNKKGYYERFDGKKYWRKLCVVEGCMKRAKVMNWCKRVSRCSDLRCDAIVWSLLQHYTEEKQKSSHAEVSTTNATNSSPLFSSSSCHHLQGISQIPMPPPSYLYTSMPTLDSSAATFPARNEIRINKRGFREQFDGIGHWRPLCTWNQCSKRAKKFSYCKRHYTERLNQNSASVATNVEIKGED